MWRAYLAILVALSLVLIQAPLARCKQRREADEPVNGADAGQPSKDQVQSQNNSKPAPDKRVEKIARTVRKIGIGSKITAFLNNGDELHGTVSKIDAESFEVAEVDLKQVFTLQYKYVKKIRSGYGAVNVFTGKRTSPPQGFRIGVLAGTLFLALGLPLIFIATAKD
jgi:hypothetical protein